MTRKVLPSSRPSRGRLAFAVLLGSATPVAAGETGPCPAFLADARRLVVVTARSPDTVPARVRLFSREAASEAWRPAGAAEPAVVGSGGLAWGNPFRAMARPGETVKAEGDRRTPIGIYRIGRSFGFMRSGRPGHLRLRPGETICVDDPASPAYNTLVSRRDGAPPRGEDMGAEPLYRRGLVIDYPTDPGKRAGSCIFLHVWRGPGRGTAGCVALPEGRVGAVQDFSSRPGSAIAILPETAIDRFAECLPGIGEVR